ncbi:MAG: NUDIX hydrolase [Nitrospirae bacterium]|nr:NUDIX hydrolase [Nitrospirota bacterium]
MKNNETQSGPGYILRKRLLACENSKFKVFFDHLDGGEANTTPDYLVVEPKNIAVDLVSGVAILPFLEEKIGLIRVYRHAIRDWSWEIPRGFIDSEEIPVVSAMRELEEETGLTSEPKFMRSLGYVTPEAGLLAGRIHLFAATHCDKSKNFKMTELGHREIHFVTKPELLSMLENEIQDPCTLVAFFRYELLLKKNENGGETH